MRIELISEDIYSFAEVISEYETSVLTVKLRGRIRAVSSVIRVNHARRALYIPFHNSQPERARWESNHSMHANHICIVAI